MLSLINLGLEISARRKFRRLSQSELAEKAGISRATLDALENGRAGELGFSKIGRILSSLGLELKLQEATQRRPTFEELVEEDRNDQRLDRRR